MKKYLIALIFVAATFTSPVQAQKKLRPDAFPPKEEPSETKAITMASSPEQMASWDRYPTYSTYVTMMQQWAEAYPNLCRLDTLGTSGAGRLILSMEISSALNDSTLPEFFYSSTMHGDEITGYVMMLRLIDTLLSSYGECPRLTALIDSIHICINPLANPDGTYHGGNNSVQNSWRYTSTYSIDLNRLFPDPFSNSTITLPQENTAMINYLNRHHFRLSANLHGGAEVLNYPWDSFTSTQRPHPYQDWWIAVCERLIDTLHLYTSSHFIDVEDNGYINGGDWYVIGGGRQDYVNHYHNCLEMTMEISTSKKLSSNQLPTYWRFLSPMLISYIEEIFTLPNNDEDPVGIDHTPLSTLNAPLTAGPNPATDHITLNGLTPGTPLALYDMTGHLLWMRTAQNESETLNISDLHGGIYMLRTSKGAIKVVKR